MPAGRLAAMPVEPWMEGVYDAERMRELDRWAIERQGVPPGADGSRGLRHGLRGGRDRAVRSCSRRVREGKQRRRRARRGEEARGDGVRRRGAVLWPPDELSDDAKANLARFEGRSRHVNTSEVGRALAETGVVVDAIFGTGFSGAPRAPADAAIEAINGADAPVVAADIASGVDASTGEVDGAAVAADVTVSFHAAKLGHWIAPGKWHTGEVRG